MKQPKISVIVPVCNVEKYVCQCVESLINQSLPEIEIICINDGSTDNSLDMLYELNRRDARIRVIDKENTGYGDTVNTGIKAAKGEYIAILESDDFAVPDMYEKLYSKAIDNNADLVKGNYYNYFTENDESEFSEYLGWLPYERLLSSEERNQLIFSEPAIWSGIYRRSFLSDNHIAFLPTPGASYQDASFAYKTALCAENIILVREPVLYYRKDNQNSSVKDDRKVFCICDEFEEIYHFMMERGYKDELPVYVKAMYYRYKWNLERLKTESRPKFLLKMYSQFREACFSGWLDKKYWNDSEWEYIHRFIFDFPAIYAAVMKTNSDEDLELRRKKMLLTLLRDSSPLFVYGAGIRSTRLLMALRKYNIYPDGIVVTELNGNPETLEGIPVMDIQHVSECRRDALILLGVGERYKSDILNLLKEKHMKNNCFSIDGHMWSLLERDES